MFNVSLFLFQVSSFYFLKELGNINYALLLSSSIGASHYIILSTYMKRKLYIMIKNTIKNILLLFDDNLFRWIVKLAYPEYRRPRKGYCYNFEIIRRYFFMQKILRFNGSVPWPVDFRSKILGYKYIRKGIMCDPGDNIGIYINAFGGLIIGDNVNIGQNTTITTTNHNIYDHRKTGDKKE